MKVLFIILSTLLASYNGMRAQEVDTLLIEDLFFDQISYFPQEKIHVQTDRNTYTPGETIWFRVHLVDALLLKQANASRYVYVELINPVEDVAQRVKIRPDSTGCFYGRIELNEELPEGNYSLRAYTRFMQNQGEDYFFNKTICLTNPVSENLSPVVTFAPDKNKIEAKIHFLSQTDSTVVVPDKCLIYPEGDLKEEGQRLSFDDHNTAHYSFKKKDNNKKNIFILQTSIEGQVYNRFVSIPSMDNTFDVSFFPEGGHAPFSTDMMMAFKAINTDGLSEEITGQIFDDLGQQYTTFESQHLGMGYFRMYYSPDRKYHAICTNRNNISKRFDLPEAAKNAVSLNIVSPNNRTWRVSLTQSPTDTLPAHTQLIAHIRGAVAYAQPWDQKQGYLNFHRDFFPDGIVHFILIDQHRNILSERLIFSSQGSSLAATDITSDKDNYQTREKINIQVKLTDENQVPLSGNFSVSIVDKNDMAIDTTSNIISTLLLSSELKGYIESPMSYLQPNNRKAAMALDVLMMTQGWRRYDVPNVLKGNLTRELQYPVELGDQVTGKAEGVFSVLKEGGISLLALNDSVLGTSFTKPDAKGKFTFRDLEYPNGTRYIIQAVTKKGSSKVFLEMESALPFPEIKIPPITTRQDLPIATDAYQQKTEQKYALESSVRIHDLAEVEVTAKRKTIIKTKSVYYSPASSSMVLTAEDVERWNPLSVFDLLRRLPGVSILGNEVRYRNGTPMVLLDDIPQNGFDYDMLNVNDIGDVFVAPAISMMPIFGSQAAGGAIVINTKRGFVPQNKISSNIQVVNPVGYQQPVEFYSPAYDTNEAKSNPALDLRSTIYWNPNIQVDESGTANISFYAADIFTQYGVVIEGVSSLGHLIYSGQQEVKIGQ